MTSEQSSLEEHIARLSALKPGTPVTYFRGAKKYRGVFKTWATEGNIRYFVVQVATTGGETRYIPLHQLRDVAVASSKNETLPKYASGRAVTGNIPFVTPLLKGRDVNEFVRRSILDCVILGRVNALRNEIDGVQFASKAGPATFAEGTLQDVLRVREFSSAMSTYRSSVLSIESTGTNDGMDTPVVIFDGAMPFLKHHHAWPLPNRILVLDRTERGFQSAVDTLNQEYVTEAVTDVNLDIGVVPDGIEMVAFQKSRS